MNKNLWIGLGVILVVIVLGAALLRHPKTASGQSYTIGGVLPLTSPLGNIGEEINRGALLAVDDYKKEGITVNYDSQDDGFDPKRSVSASNKLLQIDHSQAVFTATWEEAEPVAQIFNQAKVPLLISWDNNKTLQSAGPYVFSIGFSTERDGALMADYAYDTLALRSVAIVEAVDPVAKIMVDSFAEEFKVKGGRVLGRESVQPDTTDFRTTIPKVEQLNPEAIYFLLIPPQSATFLPQVRRTGYSGALLSGDGLFQSDIQSAGAAANGVYYTTIYTDHPEAITAKYKAHFGSDPADTTLVSFGYNSVKLLVTGLQDARSKGVSLRDALMNVKVDSLGTELNMHGSQSLERIEKVFKVVNGQSVPQ